MRIHHPKSDNFGQGTQDGGFTLETRSFIVVLLSINVCDSMGANLINTICEGVAPVIAGLVNGRVGLRVLTNLCVERRASARFRIPVSKMAEKGFKGRSVAQRILEAYQLACCSKLRAVTHNKGVMNGIDAVALATGQDWRAVESAAHSSAHDAKTGLYGPLTHYRIVEGPDGEEELFEGSIDMPISVGTRGGVLQSNPLYG